MKRATPSRVLSLLKKSSSLSYAQLAENFTAPQKLAEVLQSLEDSETILCDQRGNYLLSRRTQRLEQLPGFIDRSYTGIAVYAKGHWYLRSLTPHSPPDIQIRGSKGLIDGEIVTVEIDRVDIDHYYGKVVAKIPVADEASRAALALLTAFEVPHGDPWDPKRKKFSEFINAKTAQDRIDLRRVAHVSSYCRCRALRTTERRA